MSSSHVLPLPCSRQSFDEPVKVAERKNLLATSLLAGGNRLWCDPDGKKDYVEELLGSGRIVEPKVLDIGESKDERPDKGNAKGLTARIGSLSLS